MLAQEAEIRVLSQHQQNDHAYASFVQESGRPTAKKRKLTYSNMYEQTKPLTVEYIDSIFQYVEHVCATLVNPSYDNSINKQFSTEFNTMIKLISSAKSLEDIVNSCEHLDILYETDELGELMNVFGIRCQVCYTVANSKTGLFQIRPNECYYYKERGSTEKLMTQKFRSTKTHIREHLLSHKHGFNVASANQNIENNSFATQSYMEEKLEKLMLMIQSFQKRQVAPQKQPERKTQNNVDIKKAASVPEILQSSKHLQFHYPNTERENLRDFDGIICVPCYNARTEKNQQTKTGFFGFESLLGSNFGGLKLGQPVQIDKFKQLKSSIGYHLNSISHLRTVKETPVTTECEKLRKEQDRKIGISLGTVAYYCVIRLQSKISYEELVTLRIDIGVPLGDINHSVQFVHRFVPKLYEVLKANTITTLTKPLKYAIDPSPFVLFADKITPYATTQQIIGIINLQDGKNKAYLLDIVPVAHHDGKSIAKYIVDTLLKFFTPELAKKLYLGCSFDGQYLMLGVPNHILKLLGIQYADEMSKEQQAETYFHSVSWDPAHLIELACGDIKKGKKYPWVENVEQAIVVINRKNTYGKHYLDLLEETKLTDPSLQKNLLRPGSFCETRFSSYKYEVLYRFDHNYEALYNKLAKAGDDDLNRINCATFCLRLCALQDIFKLIGEMSKKVQSSQLYPWQCDADVELCIQKLTSMAAALTLETNDNIDLKKFNAAVTEISTLGSFNKKAVFIQQSVSHVTRSHSKRVKDDTSFAVVIKRIKKEVAEYLRDVVDSMNERFSKNHEQKVFILGRESFSADRILARNPNNVPVSFTQYCSMARNIGFVDNISQESLNEEYQVFSHAVHKFASQYRDSKTNILDECGLYSHIFSSCDEFYTNTDIVSLVASAIVRNKSECLAESIGSQVKLHLEGRCRLCNENLGREMFLHFNGPKPHRESQGLIISALNELFGGSSWHFSRTSAPAGLQTFEISKVVDKKYRETGRVVVPS